MPEQEICPECGSRLIECDPPETQENFDRPYTTVGCMCQDCGCEFTETFLGSDYAGTININP